MRGLMGQTNDLDACCLNRPFDDQTQDRIHLESEAVILILHHVRSANLEMIEQKTRH
jgi:hypothetical protein